MALVCTRMPAARAGAELASARLADWFPGAPRPEAALAGLWLRLGAWDRAHAAAQDLSSAEGSYWHAIVHRQEPDAWNAGYWFRRVGGHPVFGPLSREAATLAGGHPGAEFTLKGEWDPFAFVEFCESAAARPGGQEEALALAIQEAEWRVLFDWCVRG